MKRKIEQRQREGWVTNGGKTSERRDEENVKEFNVIIYILKRYTILVFKLLLKSLQKKARRLL